MPARYNRSRNCMVSVLGSLFPPCSFFLSIAAASGVPLLSYSEHRRAGRLASRDTIASNLCSRDGFATSLCIFPTPIRKTRPTSLTFASSFLRCSRRKIFRSFRDSPLRTIATATTSTGYLCDTNRRPFLRGYRSRGMHHPAPFAPIGITISMRRIGQKILSRGRYSHPPHLQSVLDTWYFRQRNVRRRYKAHRSQGVTFSLSYIPSILGKCFASQMFFVCSSINLLARADRVAFLFGVPRIFAPTVHRPDYTNTLRPAQEARAYRIGQAARQRAETKCWKEYGRSRFVVQIVNAQRLRTKRSTIVSVSRGTHQVASNQFFQGR